MAAGVLGKLYEPVIRRAAGLGALSEKPNEDTYERAYAHCDVLVIGAGPAGLWAAYQLAQTGLDVILADEDFRMGGRLNSEGIRSAANQPRIGRPIWLRNWMY